MKIKVQVAFESDGGGTKAVEKIACLERGMLRPAELGLTLDEAEDLLESMQHTLVEQQVSEYLEQQAHCPCCVKKRRRKGHHNPTCVSHTVTTPNSYRIMESVTAMVRPSPPRLWNRSLIGW